MGWRVVGSPLATIDRRELGMAGKADFTEDEWNTLHRGLTGAGMLVSLSERGFGSTFKESGAMAKFLSEARTTSPSELVRDLAATKGTGWKVSSSIEDVRSGTVTALTQAVGTLNEKDPEELGAYRAAVLGLSQAVSDAGKGGDEAEAVSIETIRESLGG
jgi:hypothetical protein